MGWPRLSLHLLQATHNGHSHASQFAHIYTSSLLQSCITCSLCNTNCILSYSSESHVRYHRLQQLSPNCILQGNRRISPPLLHRSKSTVQCCQLCYSASSDLSSFPGVCCLCCKVVQFSCDLQTCNEVMAAIIPLLALV